MKKVFLAAIILMAVIFVTSKAVSVMTAAEEVSNGTCGENLTWVLENGTLTISGTGEMTDYTFSVPGENPPWYAKRSLITDIIINDGVTSIGKLAFRNCNELQKAVLADSVNEIGACAFQYCSKLESINIPYGVRDISVRMFDGCYSLSFVEIPDSVTGIQGYAFHDCTALTSIEIPAGVLQINREAFYNCSALRTVTMHKGIKNIYTDAFSYCTSLESIIIPESVMLIHPYAFYKCESLELAIVPPKVNCVKAHAFEGCKNAVIYHNTLSLEEDCFKNTKAVVKYETKDGKAYIIEITGNKNDISLPEKIYEYDVIYEDISSGACVYETADII
ncbi:MAG: leucine-rich repeat domain-containing protein [Oscillospiraceae bacterium]|nr:leucine-rich repeat domain-containing protein [Oscillospiraceae bacterium]